jgi:ABC-2 type transport system ATP-binding protein
MNPLVRASNLVKSFPEVTAVSDVSLEINPGEIFGIVGPDGAGKTTILRIISGILKPDSGSIKLFGEKVEADSTSHKNKIAYMKQGFGLYPDLTVKENVQFYADLFGVEESELDEKIDSLLKFSYMHPFKNRLAGRLSGGMKQKLQLVCALIHEPEILILDEPTNGVDPVSRRDFWRMLQALLDKGVAILLSTSYLDESERCHRIAMMYEGKFLKMGDPTKIKEMFPAHVYRWQSEGARKVFAALQAKYPEEDFGLFGNTIKFLGAEKDELKVDYLEAIAKEKAITGEWHEDVQAQLEDVFVGLIHSLSKIEKRERISYDSSPNGKLDYSVKIENLTKVFGDFTAVDNISLKVNPGEIFGFLGPNGAGKSTTIRMLCGLLLPSSGTGIIAGLDVMKTPEKIRQKIGYMSQKFSLYDDLTVAENIRFYGGIYGLTGSKLASRIEWALKLARLEKLRQTKVVFLSVGFKQRLALTCSILHEPSILFLDEPTSGVDPLTRRQFWDMIYELSDQGVTVFVTTHYREEAEFCDRIAFINRGKLMAVGSPAELKQNVVKDKIYNLPQTSGNRVLSKLQKDSIVKDVYLYGSGLHLVISPEISAKSRLEELLKAEGFKSDLEEIQPGMEDVFVHLSNIIEESETKEFRQ